MREEGGGRKKEEEDGRHRWPDVERREGAGSGQRACQEGRSERGHHEYIGKRGITEPYLPYLLRPGQAAVPVRSAEYRAPSTSS